MASSNESNRSGGPGRTSNQGRSESSGGEKNPVADSGMKQGGGRSSSTSRGGGSSRSSASKGGGKERKGSSVPSQKGK